MTTLLKPPIPEASSIMRIGGDEYAALKKQLLSAGLFNRNPWFYLAHMALLATLFLVVIVVVLASHAIWTRLLAAALLAFVFTHIGFLIHDAGHRQILRTTKANDCLLIVLSTLVGISRSWWVTSHNKHHGSSNILELDPHLNVSVLAFTQEQAIAKRGVLALVIRLQAFYFFPLLALEAINMRYASLRTLLHGKSTYHSLERASLCFHFISYALLITKVMSLPEALLFIAVHHSLAGIYMGSIFAPNHKGMPVDLSKDSIPFLTRQVQSSRNIRPGLLTDFWCGGLNYQIEHHLFPTLPRNNLKAARSIIRAYCLENGVPYTETSFAGAYIEVFKYLREVVSLKGDLPLLATGESGS